MFVHNGLTFLYRVTKFRSEPSWCQLKVEHFHTNNVNKAYVVYQDMTANLQFDKGAVVLEIHDDTDEPLKLRQESTKDE